MTIPGWSAEGLREFGFAQEHLEARVLDRTARHVFIDPDGSLPPYLGVVIQMPTGVIYGHQCAGVATETRYVEGYWIPVGGLKSVPDDGFVDPAALTDVFHSGGGCVYDWVGTNLPAERAATLRNLVASIPLRHSTNGGQSPLGLRAASIEEVAEGWVPVDTFDGPGILMWKNCD